MPEPCQQVLPSGWVRFTADQMQAFARAAVLLERERCAKVCEENVVTDDHAEGVILKPHRGPLSHDGQRYAAAIRKGTP